MAPPSAARPGAVLIAKVGTVGDMHPFLGLGQALQRRGHAVLFMTSPVHADRVRACDMAFMRLGSLGNFEAMVDDPALWGPRTAMSVFWRGLRGSLQRLPEAALALPACLPACRPLCWCTRCCCRRPTWRVPAGWACWWWRPGWRRRTCAATMVR